MLLAAPAVDEVCSAGPTVAAPGIRDELGVGVASLALLALVVPVALSLALEPVALWWADGSRRRPLLVGSAWVWATALAVAGLATGPWMLGAALLVAGPASGVALGVAQIALIARARESGHDPERTLARWTLSA